MRRLRPVWIAALLVVLAAGALSAWADGLPPRTPQKFARVVSGLPLPRRAAVIEWEDDWPAGLQPDGRSRVVLQLTARAFDETAAAAERAGYARLSAAGTLPEAVDVARGWYRAEGDPAGTRRVVVLDAARRRVLVLYQQI